MSETVDEMARIGVQPNGVGLGLPGQAIDETSPPSPVRRAIVEPIEPPVTTVKRESANEQTVVPSTSTQRPSSGRSHGSVYNSSRLASVKLSLAEMATKAMSKNGMFSTIVYVVFATMLAVSTYGLNTMANQPINLGIVEQAWFHDVFDIPINTFMQGTTTIADIKANVLSQNLTYGTQSLSDLQYDTCGVRDTVCQEKVRPNTERVLYSLANSFSLISGFDVPDLAASPDKIHLSYVNTLSGYNFPVVQYWIPGNDVGVVCSVRRNRYRVAQETTSQGEIDSVAICSKRKYDPQWVCENEVAKDVASYIIKIKLNKVTYLGQTLRGEMYYKPGNIAKLTGSAQGTGLLSTVIGIDEYNGGIIQSSAPWDMAPAYLCQGTFDKDTYAGMRWQGQGIVSMTWKSSSLMVTNSFVLWSVMMSLALIQFVYLPRSSVCVIPVNMAKSLVGPVILAFACYGNYNVQVLTTYLNLNKVTSFNVVPYRLCGPVMFASVIAVMSGTAIQMFFNPLLVSPSYVLTIVSVVNWIVVFVLEAFVFPKNSVMLSRACGLATSTTCSYYSGTVKQYYWSPLIAAGAIGLGIVALIIIRRRTVKLQLPGSNSVLKLLNSKSVHRLATSGAGGCITMSADGQPLVDAGILLNKNLVRISSSAIVRSCIVKYVMVYRLLPPIFRRQVSNMVGVSMVIRAKGDMVTKELVFLELKDMKIEGTTNIPSYYS